MSSRKVKARRLSLGRFPTPGCLVCHRARPWKAEPRKHTNASSRVTLAGQSCPAVPSPYAGAARAGPPRRPVEVPAYLQDGRRGEGPAPLGD